MTESLIDKQLIDKQRVADSFSRAANTYDDSAELQRDVGSQLLSCLPEAKTIEVVLDLGCGTGFFTPALKQQYPDAQLLNLDLAQGMLKFARDHRPAANTHWLCADAESLPLADNSVDLIFSSLAIQWCENLPQLFAEIDRVLKPGGRFCFATLGPDTLHELKSAWQAADTYVHVNKFETASALYDALPATLAVAAFTEEPKVLRYQALKHLTDELKGIGAHNMNSGQQTGLTGREKVKRFKLAYEAQRMQDGYLPATYQVFYLVVEKDMGKQAKTL